VCEWRVGGEGIESNSRMCQAQCARLAFSLCLCLCLCFSRTKEKMLVDDDYTTAIHDVVFVSINPRSNKANSLYTRDAARQH
jgi:hypothetical protein